jgi:hypothetical protein
MSEIDTYLKCNAHNTIVVRNIHLVGPRFIHKKSGTLCSSTKFTLIRSTIIGREEAFEWADRIARGVEVPVGAGNS